MCFTGNHTLGFLSVLPRPRPLAPCPPQCALPRKACTAVNQRHKYTPGPLPPLTHIHPHLCRNRALYHVEFDELQVNFDFNDKHREALCEAKLPVLLNLCQCLAKSGRAATGGGRDENANRASEYAGQAIELDATVRRGVRAAFSFEESLNCCPRTCRSGW